MRLTRTFAAAGAASLLAVGPMAAVATATAESTGEGIGTGRVASTVLRVDLGTDGGLLSVRVLSDDGIANIDPDQGTPASAATLHPMTVQSRTVPALDLAAPAVGTASSGPEDRKSVEPSLPSSPAFSGTVNAILSSVVDAAGARSGLTAGAANVNLVGGLVRMPSGTVKMASRATDSSATGTRTIDIPEVRVLDLAALLDGLGLELTDLSVEQLLGLLGALGIELPDLPDPGGAVDALNEAIDTVQASTGAITAELCATVDGLLADTLGGLAGLGETVDELPQVIEDVTSELPELDEDDPLLGGDDGLLDGGDDDLLDKGDDLLDGGVLGFGTAALLPDDFSCTNLTGTVDDLVDTLQASLASLLIGAMVELGETSLLTVEDVVVGLEAVATDSTETSVATVTASIGAVRVGTVAVPGVGALDLGLPASVLEQANATIEEAVNSVLTTLDAGLADLVDVEVLDIEELVDSAGDYTTATSTVTAVRATITPPTSLGSAALIDLGTTPADEVLDSLNATLPVLSPAMAGLEAALGGIEALDAPAVVTIGQLSGTATFRPAAATTAPGEGGDPVASPTPVGELPRTGGPAALPAVGAMTLGGLGLALRRLLRRATA